MPSSRVVVLCSVAAMFEVLQKTRARFLGILGLSLTHFLWARFKGCFCGVILDLVLDLRV